MLSGFTALEVYFLITASVVHVLQSYHDFKTMKVDSRLNAFMLGTVCAMMLTEPSIYQLVLLIIAGIVVFSMKLTKAIGTGDREIVFWSILGIGQFGNEFLKLFLMGIVIYTVLGVHISRKLEKKIPFAPFIAIPYFATVYAVATSSVI